VIIGELWSGGSGVGLGQSRFAKNGIYTGTGVDVINDAQPREKGVLIVIYESMRGSDVK
jgi:hypothetical protein